MATILPAPHAHKIQWLSDNPVWVDQWPLSKEKLEATSLLVQEQLEAGHLIVIISMEHANIRNQKEVRQMEIVTGFKKG